jgi:ribA/ribD-fused uncharacterized protein
MTPDPAAVAARLSKTQRRWLKGARPSQFLPSVYVSYPPPNTHAVLKRLGLQLNSGDLTPSASPSAATSKEPTMQIERIECHGLDTPERVCFYEQDFYVLSNFSAFSVIWAGRRFPTSEHLYHWLRFRSSDTARAISEAVANAASAHEAFKLAQEFKAHQRDDWNAVKVDRMRDILRAKATQHEYVRRKLLATGDRELVENSWRDDFWGWGPNRDGQNMLGKLWMEVRAELRGGDHA